MVKGPTIVYTPYFASANSEVIGENHTSTSERA